MMRTILEGGEETGNNTPNSPANEKFDPSLGCPSNAEEWDIYWEWTGLKMDSTIIVTCLKEVNYQSVRVRPRTPKTEHPRNTSSNLNKLTNDSAILYNSTSVTLTQLSLKEVTIVFIVVMVLIFIGVFFFITFFITKERVNPELIRQAAENQVFLDVTSECEDNNRIDTR